MERRDTISSGITTIRCKSDEKLIFKRMVLRQHVDIGEVLLKKCHRSCVTFSMSPFMRCSHRDLSVHKSASVNSS